MLRGLLLLCISFPLAAQSTAAPANTNPPKPISYELVAIHKSKPDANGWNMNNTPEGFIANAVQLRALLSEAYGFSLGQVLKEQIVGLPSWAETQRFDINAKVDVSNLAQLKALRDADTMAGEVESMTRRKPNPEMQMMQRLMEEYFHLKMHYEQRVMPVYVMTVAKGGVKMKVASTKDPEHGSMTLNEGKFTAENVPADFLTLFLTLEVGRPVINQTNLPGQYDVEMTFTPDQKISASAEDTGPSIFTALTEQMGLKLSPSKEPVWVIVVDHVEMPSDN